MFKPHHLPETGNGPYLSSNFRCCSVQRIIGYPQLGQVETILLLKFGSTKSPDLIYPTGKININQHVCTPQSHLVDHLMSSLFHWLQHAVSRSPSVSTNRPRGRVGPPETTSSRGMWSKICEHCIALPCGLDMQLISAMHLPRNIIIQNGVPHNLLWCILHTKIAILGCTV
jgi:hypothetical protein